MSDIHCLLALSAIALEIIEKIWPQKEATPFHLDHPATTSLVRFRALTLYSTIT